MTNALIDEGYRLAAGITRSRARDIYRISQLIPEPLRQHIYAVCAFCSMCTDAAGNDDSPVLGLANARSVLDEAYSGHACAHPVGAAFQHTVHAHRIPREHFDDLMDEMNDASATLRYADFDALKKHCHRSLGVIGLIVLALLQIEDPTLERYADDLGIAIRLTQIMQNINQDISHGRIFLPMDEMKAHYLTENDLETKKCNGGFKACLRIQLDRARSLYRSADKGIVAIRNWRTRLAIRAFARINEGILDEIETADYDVFRKNTMTTEWFKFKTLVSSFLSA